MTQPAPKYGHNAPPNEAEALVENLHERHRAIVERAEELIEAAERVPENIEDEETAARTSDFIKQIASCRKTLETTRVGEKEPYLAAGRAVDGYFKRTIDPLDQAKKAVQRRLDPFLRQKQRERRDRIHAEAKEDMAAQAAAARQGEWLPPWETPSAKRREEEAQKARREKAETVQQRGEYGAVATLREVWTFDEIDRETIDLETLRRYIPQDALEKALRGFIKDGGRTIKGARIYQDYKSFVR